MSHQSPDQFALRSVCSECPFRKDRKGVDLSPGRREEIIRDLLTAKMSTFFCHKTTFGEYEDQKHCAGAAALCNKYGRDTQMMQVAKRLKAIDEDHLDPAMENSMDPDDINLSRNEVYLPEKEEAE